MGREQSSESFLFSPLPRLHPEGWGHSSIHPLLGWVTELKDTCLLDLELRGWLQPEIHATHLGIFSKRKFSFRRSWGELSSCPSSSPLGDDHERPDWISGPRMLETQKNPSGKPPEITQLLLLLWNLPCAPISIIFLKHMVHAKEKLKLFKKGVHWKVSSPLSHPHPLVPRTRPCTLFLVASSRESLYVMLIIIIIPSLCWPLPTS